MNKLNAIIILLVLILATTNKSTTIIKDVESDTSTITEKPSQKLSDYEIAMWTLKSHESLHYRSYWDYKQYTIGWGTKSNKHEKVDYHEANTRAKKVYQKRFNSIAKRYPNLSRFQKLIMTNFEYNTRIGKDLDESLKNGNLQEVKRNMNRYVHAGGKRLDGLVKRRAQESYLLTATEDQKQAFGRKAKILVKSHIKKAKK